MNFYVVVEGRVGEKIVYKTWIPQINPSLTHVNKISDIRDNNFFIVSGGGYPSYFNTIKDAISDANNELNNINRLIVCVDAEEMSYAEKYREIDELVISNLCRVEVRIVIQYFCFEAWALGNRRIGPRKNLDETLRRYQQCFDVLKNDPEDLPSYPPEKLNRSQFAAKYLKKLINNKSKHGTYTKSNPEFINHPQYFHHVKSRYFDTLHIKSFGNFLNAFS
jgi:hypothetical protein